MQPVGCDLQLNSQLKIDGCGVCGGDGSTCDGASNKSNNNNKSDIIEEEETYRWEYGHRLSACSASCDGGKKSDQSPSSLSMSLILVNRNQSNWKSQQILIGNKKNDRKKKERKKKNKYRVFFGNGNGGSFVSRWPISIQQEGFIRRHFLFWLFSIFIIISCFFHPSK